MRSDTGLAIDGRFQGSMADVFPAGAFMVGDVEAVPGLSFRPVEFDGLRVTPYVDDKRNRVAYSLRARSMRGPVTSSVQAPGKPGGADRKAAA
ncbi:MAG: hypothetical protein ACRDTT_07930 [Pseudonocardiaceae bacterium]